MLEFRLPKYTATFLSAPPYFLLHLYVFIEYQFCPYGKNNLTHYFLLSPLGVGAPPFVFIGWR